MTASGLFHLVLYEKSDGDFVVADWERTSLKPYVEMLERHSLGLMEEVRKSKIGKTGLYSY